MDYRIDLNYICNELLENNYCFLPSVEGFFDKEEILDLAVKELGEKNYKESSNVHELIFEKLNFMDLLQKDLYELAVNNFGFSGDVNDVYNVTRLVKPGDSNEGFRGHFDAHIFTLVLPINIPNNSQKINNGELVFFPRARTYPSSEILNIIGKLKYKKFSNSEGFSALKFKHEHFIEDFLSYKPLLFLGRTTLHGNAPVSLSAATPRLTLLSHFFDPGKFGLSALLRKIRDR